MVGGCRAGWFGGRASDCQLRGPSSRPPAAVSKLGQFRLLHVAPVHPAEYLRTDSEGIPVMELRTNSFRAAIIAWLDDSKEIHMC